METLVEEIDWAAALACLEALVLLALVPPGIHPIRRTTLRAPLDWTWLFAGLLTLGAARMIAGDIRHDTVGYSAIRYFIAVATFCPLMAVLGAKRPQDRGWKWVVLSLCGVLTTPAWQSLIVDTGGTHVQIFVAWKLFIVGLIGVGLLCYLPTRFWFAAICYAAGQSVLFSEFLLSDPIVDVRWILPAGLALFLGAALVVKRLAQPVPTLDDQAGKVDDFNRQWLWFRDAFGAFWALRILQRINETAQLCNWPVRLEWHGFEPIKNSADMTLNVDQLAEIDRTLRTLLRRFLQPVR